jgi:hypothetical protein
MNDILMPKIQANLTSNISKRSPFIAHENRVKITGLTLTTTQKNSRDLIKIHHQQQITQFSIK